MIGVGRILPVLVFVLESHPFWRPLAAIGRLLQKSVKSHFGQ